MTVGVRNGVLARQLTTVDGFTLLGTVPSGLTWLLKTVHVLNASPVASDVFIQLNSASGGIVAYLVVWTIEADEPKTWEGWTALQPGDELFVHGPAQLHVWASGAELPGVKA